MVEERRRPAVQQSDASTSNGRNKSRIAKPFRINKQEVVAAWERVRNNGGAAGVDKQTIGLFENDLKNNLYAVWNRMSSGSYFPEPVRRVEIPKGDGKLRPLGIPTVKDRIAQEIVRARLEVKLEAVFDPDSYGFRPGRSALDAVGVCRKRCFEFKWVVDVDIEKFFDTIDHEKMMKAVRFHCGEPEQKWMILYIERWLKAGVLKDGELQPTVRGTPQGGVISPLLANLYLHYAIDEWMNRTYPECPFERYADDFVIHCSSESQAQEVMAALDKRLIEVGLKLHPEKTRIVHCGAKRKTTQNDNISFTFLGYTFQPRRAKNKKTGQLFTSFLPAVSTKAKQKLRNKLKEMKLFKNTSQDVFELARRLNPIIRGWLNYFTKYSKAIATSISIYLDSCLIHWVMRKYRLGWKKAILMLNRIYAWRPQYFVHWQFFRF